MKKKYTLRYPDLGKAESAQLKGEIEVILSRSQADLLRRYNSVIVDSRHEHRSKIIFWLLSFKIFLTWPRLLFLSEYYDPEELELAGFERVGEEDVRLMFYK